MITSESIQDYLKQTYKLQEEHEYVTISQLAEKLQVSAPSVTQMVKKLAKEKLVDYTPYQGVMLTEKGKKIALEVIRHHRLLELFLSEILGYPLEKVDEEAEKLEHFISEEFEQKINERLGNPKVDPHGDPIPTIDGKVSRHNYLSLAEVSAGDKLVIKRVSDFNPDMLRYMNELGLLPNVHLEVMGKEPFNGPLKVKMDDREVVVGNDLAKAIFVEVI
ncbi:MAG: metal-dependent transcriptional regulator [Bacteroidota bacterium]